MPGRNEVNGAGKSPRVATPALSEGLQEATAGEPAATDDFLDGLANKLASIMQGNGSSPPPPPSRKEFLGLTGGGWTKLLGGIIIATSVTAGTWVLFVRDTLKAHGSALKSHTSQPMHKETAKELNGFSVRVSVLEQAAKDYNEKQTQVIKGLNELKAENIKELKDELNELKRENRKLERLRNR